MRKHVSWLIPTVLVVGAVCLILSPTWTNECLAALGVSALEKEVARADVPEPVMAMILKEAKGNEIEDVEVSDHGLVKVYEADWDAGEEHVEVRVMYLCRLVGRTFENPSFDDGEDEGDEDEEGDDGDDDDDEVSERAVSFNQVPAAVSDALVKAAGKSMVREIEEIVTKKGTFYEAEWIVEGWEIDLLLTAEGKMVRKEMELIWDDDDEGDDEDDDDDDDDDDDHDDDDE